MKPYGWLLSVLLLLGWGTPAEAARLLFWRFDQDDSRLVFTTDESILPTARLLSNPTRLIIDLPGVELSGRQSSTEQTGSGAIASVRSEQVDGVDSRLIIELRPGYQVDPQAISIRGTSPTRWQVDLPVPSIASDVRTSLPPLPPQETPPPTQQAETNPSMGIITALELSAGNQLLIRGEGAIAGSGRWNVQERAYQIVLPNARFARDLSQPRLLGSPISQIKLRQRGETVEILVYPAVNYEVRRLSQLSRNLLGVELQRQAVARPPSPPTTRPLPPTPTPGPSTPLPRPTGSDLVVIDPGHGGRDPGAIGIGGLREKDVVLPISLEISQILQRQGVRVLMTRSDDRYISLAGRTQMANQARADIFVSVHANAISMSRPDVNGVETYYFSSGARLARSIHQSILQSIPMRNRGIKTARFYVLRTASMPAVLVEVGFVTGRDDAPRLANPTFRSQMAQAIARGILLYLQQN